MKQPIDPRGQLNLMAVCAAMVLAAVVLRVDGEGGIYLPYVDAAPLPGSCLMRTALHIDCPGCGMTRSFVAMARGQLAQAWRFHRLGPLLFIYVLLQVPLRAWVLLGGSPRLLRLQSRHAARLLWAFLAVLVVNWVYNLATGAAFHWGR